MTAPQDPSAQKPQPPGEGKPQPQGEAKPQPAGESKPQPSGETKPPSGETKPPSGETKPPSGESKPQPSGESKGQPGNGKRKPIDPGQAHVLVVEDNVPNFVLIARMLAYMGVQRCEWKTSGWQVVEFADTLPRIDLILMDIRLPYEDGFQALEKVRSNARLKETLIVAVTAEASVEQMKRAQEAGFDGFLGKPLDPDRFPDQIRRVLNGEPVWEVH